jgi:hypothetical protein
MLRAVRRRRHAVDAAEARRERSDAREPDLEADLGDRVVGVSQERGRPLEPARQEVLVRRLSEGPPELAAEVGRREMGDPRERGDVERPGIAGVDRVLRAQKVPVGMGSGDDAERLAVTRIRVTQ